MAQYILDEVSTITTLRARDRDSGASNAHEEGSF